MAFVNLSHMPKPNTEYAVNFTNLNGGLNLMDLEYRLKNDESPAMKNLLWRGGVLCCRDGQEWVTHDEEVSAGIAMYDQLFNGFLVAHLRKTTRVAGRIEVNDGLYWLGPNGDEPSWELITEFGSACDRGSFFRYFGKLYYKAPGVYVEITYTEGTGFSGADIVGYVPIIQINTDPDSGAGTLYQPENRISASKTVWFNAKSGVTVYHLPVQDIDSVVSVTVNGAATTAYTVQKEAGTVTFNTAPPVTNPPTNNTVVITYSKANTEAMSSVMDCPYAATYGGTGDLCVVMGGCPAQPNAIFWNGNNIAMDPTYFPMDQYQFCGDEDDGITGFGKQQSFLVVFKQRSVGRVKQDTQTVDGRLTIDMPYVAINDKIGCDCPYSIQLIENNLVWCNAEQGVHILKDSSYAYENNIECVSKKVNGGPTKEGLLAEIRNSVPVAFDDNKRYWLNTGDHVWVWDYENTSYKDPSWYFMTNIRGVAFAVHYDDVWHLNSAGRLTHFVRNFKDYDGPIEKLYRFATQYFGGYDRLKNINSVIIVMRPEVNCTAKLTYITDYEERTDLTPLAHIAWKLVPRNLTYRSLSGVGFGISFRRKPMCRRVRHFTMQLEDSGIESVPAADIDQAGGHELSIVSAQIFYNYQGRLR
jgi:hypothetical protein